LIKIHTFVISKAMTY
jgi:hypothetical protein